MQSKYSSAKPETCKVPVTSCLDCTQPKCTHLMIYDQRAYQAKYQASHKRAKKATSKASVGF